MTSITIPNSVTSIGSQAFYDCSGLISVTIPNSVTSIDNMAFQYCSRLTSVTFCSNLSLPYPNTWNPGVFDGCNNLKEVIYADGCTEAFYPGLSSIESVVISNSVTSIGQSAFSNCSGLTSVTIPNSVTSIRDYAFQNCLGLTSVTIPKSVTIIDNFAFLGCDNVKELIYADGCVEALPTGLSSIEKVIFPNTITSIRDNAFAFISSLTSVPFPSSLTSIGNCAFIGCIGLTSVTIPSSVTTIGSSAFYCCSGLTSVNIEDIEAWCNINFADFYANPLHCAHRLYLNGEEIKELVVPSSFTSIGTAVCAGWSNLTSITIPNSVTSIGNSAFEDCSGLTSVTIPNSVTSIGNGAFARCSGLTSINIPNSVTAIGERAFNACSGITSVTIPNTVTSIVDYVFGNCSNLTSVTIPNNVTSIGFMAFVNCNKMHDIYSLNPEPPTCEATAFENIVKWYCRIHVPAGTKQDYAIANGWREFETILEDAETSGITAPEIKECKDNAEYYTLDGVKVSDPTTSGIYIVKKGGENKMIVVKK